MTTGIPLKQQDPAAGGWTAGRITALAAGVVLALLSLGSLAAGGVLMWADQALRSDGYLTTTATTYSTSGYALASQPAELGWGWLVAGLIGDVRVRVTALGSDQPVFVAIGPADQVAAYLSGAAYTTVASPGQGGLVSHAGTAAPAAPRTARVWAAQVAGTGPQTLRWPARTGTWMIVAMNADGSPGLAVRADVGVSASWLFQLSVELIVGGIAAGALAAALIIVPARLAASTER